MRLGRWSLFGSGTLSAIMLAASAGHAQVNLPPPPPPPLSTDSPPPPPPPRGNNTPDSRPRPRANPPPPARENRDREPPRVEDPDPPRYYRGRRTISIRGNPLTLAIGRISGDFEYLFAPHHAFIASPHYTYGAERRGELVAAASGFAISAHSSGVGIELGYRFYPTDWSQVGDPPVAWFLGPSLLLDSTKPEPNLNRFTAYGGAFDAGAKFLFGGLTFDVGGGLMVMKADNVQAKISPRILFSVGWTF